MGADEPDISNPGMERTRYDLRRTGAKLEAADPLRTGVHSRGYLPHVKREGACYFVTFRLGDSLPKEVLLNLERQKAEQLRRLAAPEHKPLTGLVTEEEINREFRRQVERYLDKGVGACHLGRSDIAELITGAMLHFVGQRYVLEDWVVMPNHVHVVLWPMPNELLSDILKSWKQFTSRRVKKMLGLNVEAFWQRESFDHWIRNDEEHARICRYIRNNPVTAKLCTRPEEWRWSSAWTGCQKPPAR